MARNYNPWQERFDAVCRKWDKLNEELKAEKDAKIAAEAKNTETKKAN